MYRCIFWHTFARLSTERKKEMIECRYFPISIKGISWKSKEDFFHYRHTRSTFFLNKLDWINKNLTYSSMDDLLVNSIKGVRLFRGCVTFNVVFSNEDHRSILLLVLAMLLSHQLHIWLWRYIHLRNVFFLSTCLCIHIHAYRLFEMRDFVIISHLLL
jgi:hypothetical protein